MAARGGYPLLCAELSLSELGDFCLGEIPCRALPSRTLFIVIICHLKIYFLFSQIINSSR